MRQASAAIAACALLASLASSTAVAEPTAITVFAASSLTEAFRAIARDFVRRQPDARVRFSFGGSQELAAQIRHGAPCDIFASADDRQMMAVKGDRPGVISQPFALNELVVAVSKTSPVAVAALADLARPRLKLVVADPAVPAGRYTVAMLQRATALKACGPAFPAKVMANVVSRETNVRQVAMKVALGEADAGIVYVSDTVGSLAGKVRTVAIPAGVNVQASYPIAVLATGSRQRLADAFVARVLSADGQRRLREYGFMPVPAGRR
jgi:molybdate transport system substrate-binding protein